ncbi:class I adenylate-forming enzyme family protein [Sporosarcina pasteurii]|uniref:Long-chain-fatty-acid--CoA ligase n=1 Tax=Sporosarcina pasteurii TaxID=1474 RepID=A0A380BHV0_SPOPA|nr:long-chain-fatty-acid--CoA ligase [Sporosarcina pasteurii]MDS9470717.1 long-chain-fatty-acid--CoA ligase [Sporosarcina pasteurii]QBQ05603.1 long-chain-fatty-acid--CoA ligase [Sporosarcina pasteurii]SUJ01707.1 Long-chain-fatty-acid--CoA ligase [Sporosarcina pasteurii]
MDIGLITRKMANSLSTEQGAKIAIKEERGRAWSYSELHSISNAYANKLRDMGVQKGDRVGILLYNCLEYFGLYFAVAKIGAIAVRLNFRLTSSELEYAINDSETKVLCFHSTLANELEGIHDKTSVEKYICLLNDNEAKPQWADSWRTLESGSTEEVEEIDIKLSDPVMLMYTSGTTGRPKGAIWTHDTTLWFSTMQSLKWNFTERQIGMTTGPLYHVGAMEDIGLPVLLMGGTLIITKSQGFQIERILAVIEEERVTDCFLFPFMIYDMLNSKDLNTFSLPDLKTIYTGGDPLLPSALEQLKEKYPHIGVVQVYGLTEGTPIAASLDPEDAFLKGHTVGKPMPITEIKIIDDYGVNLPVGEVGEIAIKSPAVSIGYWRNTEETMETFVNGWCKTGDLGVFDEEGYLSIAGRKKDMIRSGGENIYAAEIEDILYRHKEIKEVSIIGIPDQRFIEAVCAVIVKREDAQLTEEDVIQYCVEHLASFKKPKKVIFVDELPRTPSGKIQKYLLRETYSQLPEEVTINDS